MKLVSLTNMWKADGAIMGKELWNWLELKQSSQFIYHIEKSLNLQKMEVLITARKRYGGTRTHWKIALNYAKYLSPEFHIWANEVIKVGTYRCVDRYWSGSRNRPIPSWDLPGPGNVPRLSGVSGIGVGTGLPSGTRVSMYNQI